MTKFWLSTGIVIVVVLSFIHFITINNTIKKLNSESKKKIEEIQKNYQQQIKHTETSFNRQLKDKIQNFSNNITECIIFETYSGHSTFSSSEDIAQNFYICYELGNEKKRLECIKSQSVEQQAEFKRDECRKVSEGAIKILLSDDNLVGIFIENWDYKRYLGFYKSEGNVVKELSSIYNLPDKLLNSKILKEDVKVDGEYYGKVTFFYTTYYIEKIEKTLEKNIKLENAFIHKNIAEQKKQIIKYRLIEAIIFLVLLSVSIFITLHITIISPILQLKKSADQLSKGDFNHTIDTDRNDEIGILAKSFYHMKNEIKKHQDKLEDQVKERTIELEQRASELSFLNRMNNSLNKCHTEKDTYTIIENVCKQLFPNDYCYMLAINNLGTRLESVVALGYPGEKRSVEFDKCQSFYLGKKQMKNCFNFNTQCSQSISFPDHSYLCIPITIERSNTWGVFHLSFGKSGDKYSDDECQSIRESKHALAYRMIDQYSLFLTNLRLRIIDPLTGLYNRIFIKESLEKEISQFKQAGIVILNIDDFGKLNETYGNEIGDFVLKKLADFAKKSIQEKDIVCRYGGGEFLLIMPELSLTETGNRAEKIRLSIANDFGIDYSNQTLKITASFGVAGFPEHGADINDTLSVVSKALNRAKEGGKNRIVVI
ncbi:MAG: diguanylate cyclase [Desulfobacterales bacterium]|nr:diguanylate cyclase [Desulfobacterales bacterium]